MARYSSDSDSDRSSRHRRKHYGRSTRSSSCDSSDSCSYKKRSSNNNSNKYSRSRRRPRSKSGDREVVAPPQPPPPPSRSYKSSSSKESEKERRRRGKKSGSPSGRSGAATGTVRCAAVRSSDEKTASVFAKDEFCIEPRIKEQVLEEINSEGFTPKSFSSSAAAAAAAGEDNKFRNVAIDVSADAIEAPALKDPGDAPERIFHASITADREARLDKWVKKLYTLRQKAIADATHTNPT